ncbi:hypothetical protein [Methylobacterium sp. UNC378MF]|uniref:hypothetical protein n=1 Tax=Methylobacterium sp. UNC378MF TaxID=1502748 RepID=UPI001587D81E|nr:hypothetical protein [Methylobacterium sp. UNC378MF]
MHLVVAQHHVVGGARLAVSELRAVDLAPVFVPMLEGTVRVGLKVERARVPVRMADLLPGAVHARAGIVRAFVLRGVVGTRDERGRHDQRIRSRADDASMQRPLQDIRTGGVGRSGFLGHVGYFAGTRLSAAAGLRDEARGPQACEQVEEAEAAALVHFVHLLDELPETNVRVPAEGIFQRERTERPSSA